MPGSKLNIKTGNSLRAFVVFRTPPTLIAVIKNVQSFAVSLQSKFPYLPDCLHVKQPQIFVFTQLS